MINIIRIKIVNKDFSMFFIYSGFMVPDFKLTNIELIKSISFIKERR